MMGFDIHGNRLQRGYCEVHPYVRQEYPCDLCFSEILRRHEPPEPMCDICKKHPAVAEAGEYGVCSEACEHEATKRRNCLSELREIAEAIHDPRIHNTITIAEWCKEIQTELARVTAERDEWKEKAERWDAERQIVGGHNMDMKDELARAYAEIRKQTFGSRVVFDREIVELAEKAGCCTS